MMSKNKVVSIEFWPLLNTVYFERYNSAHSYTFTLTSCDRLLALLGHRIHNILSPWFTTPGDRGVYIGHMGRMYRKVLGRFGLRWLIPIRSLLIYPWWKRCDYACAFVWPYGYVPECGCPVHDPDNPDGETIRQCSALVDPGVEYVTEEQ